MSNLLQTLGLKPPRKLAVIDPGDDDAPSAGDDQIVAQAPTATPTATPAKKAGQAGAGAKQGGDTPAVAPEKAAYDKERAAVTKLRAELGKHKQAAHVTDKTGQADAALAAAATQAGVPTGRWR